MRNLLELPLSATPHNKAHWKPDFKGCKQVNFVNWAKSVACWLLLVQWVSTQSSIPWLVETTTQSAPSSSNTSTYVDSSTQGDPFFLLARGLPVFGGELFACGIHYEYRIFDNIRIFTPKGVPVLSFSSETTGLGVAIIKSVGSGLSVM